ncbi:hypothetical protein BJ085DRAFT_19800, partial [Dimargaris cristalligena]
MDAFELEDPSDWPLEELRHLDAHLRCGICKEFFTAAVSVTPCQHRFCSLCVRRALSAAAQGPADTKVTCPSCRAPIDTTHIQADPLLNDIVDAFRKGRRQLLMIVQRGLRIEADSVPNHNTKGPVIGDKKLTSTAKSVRPIRPAKNGTKVDSSLVGLDTGTHLASPTIDISADDDDDDDDDSVPSDPNLDLVECPSCQSFIASGRINSHLDRCLRGLSDPIPLAAAAPNVGSNLTISTLGPGVNGSKYGKPSKLVYSIMTDKQLRKVLKDLSIPSHGDKLALQRRHTEYLNMYLANEDASHPKPIHRIVQELATWEKVQ